MERIYIGGLDPTRLTAKEVVSRLEGIDGVDISSKDLMESDKTFFYINAISKNGDDMSALDKIAKQYNNVTWKRCKLVVQAARPHLLQRLAQERLERQEEEMNAKKEENETKESRPIPRHLRIRQRFGEEAYQVDTKPCRTNEWTDFCRVASKLRARREQHIETMRQSKNTKADKAVMTKKKMFRNRAVHLRWSDEDVVNGMHSRSEPVLDDKSSDASAHSQAESTTSTSDDDDSDNLSVSTPLENGKRETYVWSSSETDESSDDEDNDRAIEPDVQGNSDEEQEGILSESDSSESEGEEVANETMTHGGTEDSGSHSLEQHDWTSDNTDSDDTDGEGKKAVLETTPFLKPQETTEFSAAIDFSEDESSEHDSDTDDGNDSNDLIDAQVNSQDLTNDVKANLGILSSIFPEMAETSPIPLDKSSNDVHGSRRSEKVQTGWESDGLMQRFDPTKESAKKYIIETPKLDINEEDDVGGALSDHHSDSDHESQNDKNEEKTESPSGESEPRDSAVNSTDGTAAAIYEQSKLEGIFREARSLEVLESRQVEDCKPFAFGFDVGDVAPAKQPVQSSGTFAFGFDLGIEKDKDREMAGKSETIGVKPGEDDENLAAAAAAEARSETTDEPRQASNDFHRRGLFFPDDILDEYMSAFFEMNEGDRILQDPQGFLHDEHVKQQWKKERHALTLDWKRKRKYAQSRMHKKMKFR